MDAVKFIEERNRMCEFYYDRKGCCTGECPAYDIQCNDLEDLSANAKELVSIVEEWSDKHPRKTRQSEFLKQWPNARIDKSTGVLTICPAELTKECRDDRDACGAYSIETCVCNNCRREFWMQEVE